MSDLSFHIAVCNVCNKIYLPFTVGQRCKGDKCPSFSFHRTCSGEIGLQVFSSNDHLLHVSCCNEYWLLVPGAVFESFHNGGLTVLSEEHLRSEYKGRNPSQEKSIYDDIKEIEDEFRKNVSIFVDQPIEQLSLERLDAAKKSLSASNVLTTTCTGPTKQSEYVEEYGDKLKERITMFQVLRTVYDSLLSKKILPEEVTEFVESRLQQKLFPTLVAECSDDVPELVESADLIE